MAFNTFGLWRMKVRDKLSVAVIFLCLFSMASDWVFTEFLPNMTGRLWPVTTPLTITSMNVAGESRGTLVEGWAIKLQNCSHVGIEWNLGSRGGRYAQVNAQFFDPPQIRPEGRLEWDALYVDLSPSQIVSLSFADVTHDCDLWWPVVTQFYDGTGSRDRDTFDALERAFIDLGNQQIIAGGYPEMVNPIE